MTRPGWLLRSLEVAGKANSDGVSRTLRVSLCTDCRARVLVGLDADRVAVTVTADPEPVDEVGEVLALVQGRNTYDVTGSNRVRRLEHRHRWYLAGRHPRRWPVVADHVCHSPPLPVPPPPASPPATARDLEPPF